MKLNRIYSNMANFHNIKFSDGMNVVLGKVHQKTDLKKDSHNLGKSSLVELLDFMLLKEIGRESIFCKFQEVFINHIFYLQILLNDASYLTISRSIASPKTVRFKKSVTDIICNASTNWDEEFDTIGRSVEYLNNILQFDVLTDWNYRKTLSFFLRTQQDYNQVFQLSKFQGKHKDWKPIVFSMLGYNNKLLQNKYDLEDSLNDLKQKKANTLSLSEISTEDYDKIANKLEIMRNSRDQLQSKIDDFDFYSKERQINRELVDSIEQQISKLNTDEYHLCYDLEVVEKGISEKYAYDINQLKELYREVGVYFPDNITHSYEELIDFNNKVTDERNKYLKEQAKKLKVNIKSIRERLKDLSHEREKTLSVLQDRDTFKKFKSYQSEMAKMEGEIANLENQLNMLNKISAVNEQIDSLKLRIKEAGKEILANIKNDRDVPKKITEHFNDIFYKVFNENAIIYVSPNSNNNVEFKAQTINNEAEDVNADSHGTTYKKIMCAAFDLSILAAYSGNSYFRFVYHDGILEGLDNRKKSLFVQTVRDYCDRYGIQYIFSTIEDDIPSEILSSFSKEEKCLILNDNDDSGKLFGFSY